MATFVVNGFNVGTDLSLTITDPFGDVFIDGDMGLLEEAESESEDIEIKVVPITTGGIPIYATLWSGIRGHMMFTRFGPTFQQMFADLAFGYYGQGLMPQFSILMSVRNRDSSINEYIYTGVQFQKPRFGTFRATKQVEMRVDFKASLMQTTGPLTTFLAGLNAVTAAI